MSAQKDGIISSKVSVEFNIDDNRMIPYPFLIKIINY